MSVVPPFDPAAVGPGYVYAALADHLEALIRAGELPSGARLAGERDLAADYGVSVSTVRRATAVLRERGLVVTVPIKGTFVR